MFEQSALTSLGPIFGKHNVRLLKRNCFLGVFLEKINSIGNNPNPEIQSKLSKKTKTNQMSSPFFRENVHFGNRDRKKDPLVFSFSYKPKKEKNQTVMLVNSLHNGKFRYRNRSIDIFKMDGMDEFAFKDCGKNH